MSTKKFEILFHNGNVRERERDWKGEKRKREKVIRKHDFSKREKRLNIKVKTLG